MGRAKNPDAVGARFIYTGSDRFDDLLEGVTHGSRVLVSGEPATGKSTLLTEMAASYVAHVHWRVLYVTTDERVEHVAARYERLGGLAGEGFTALGTRDVAAIAGEVRRLAPRWLVIDHALPASDLKAIDWIIKRTRRCCSPFLMTTFVVTPRDLARGGKLAEWSDAWLHVDRNMERVVVTSRKKARGDNLPRHRFALGRDGLVAT